jgi:hypothetical protein
LPGPMNKGLSPVGESPAAARWSRVSYVGAFVTEDMAIPARMYPLPVYAPPVPGEYRKDLFVFVRNIVGV